MTLLEMVQKAIRKSGAKVDLPSTVTENNNLIQLFVEWVVDAWKDIQLERLGWDWRVTRDKTFAITSAAAEYTVPSTMETINTKTVVIYDDPTDASFLQYISYDEYRRRRDTMTAATSRPLYFTLTPDDMIAFWPAPDQNYTVKYDGVLKVEILDDTDDNATPARLAEEYHDGIVWQAVRYYAQHFEDGSKFQEAVDRFVPYKKYFEERAMPDMSLDLSALYGYRKYN